MCYLIMINQFIKNILSLWETDKIANFTQTFERVKNRKYCSLKRSE